ncbi:MAG: hypothetical protein ACWA6Y_06710 [Polaromonas sp.]
MDTQFFSLMVAAASFFAGLVLGWLLIRGRLGAAERARSAVQVELAKAQESARALNAERQQTLERCANLTQQADESRLALEVAQHERKQLAQQAARASTLEASLLALQTQEKASAQQLQQASTRQADSAEALNMATRQLTEADGENLTLKQQLAELSATLDELKARPAPTPVLAPTQLPVLETEVIALQDLAKSIEEEFLRIADAHRHHAAAAAALAEID